ncbi:MAG: hypothetical protein IKG53_01110 [Solobacterium sp.]|nr:hypothetical protein [Solobacterium sp.]
MPELFILFEKSNSAIGRLGRLLMPYPYTHVTVSFDGENYFSFSRRKFHDPFDAGFTEEKLAYFAYEKVEVKIYRMPISEEEKDKITAFAASVSECPFDVADMILMPISRGHKNPNGYNCMSFVADVLRILQIQLPREGYENNIEDIENALQNAGLKGEIVVLEPQWDEAYMAKVPIREKMYSLAVLLGKLYGKNGSDRLRK